MIGIILLSIFGAVAGVFLYSAWIGAGWTLGGFAIAGTGGIGSSLVSGYTGMYVWLERGYSGESYAGLVLLIGLCAFVLVMLMNMALSGGKTAVQ